MQYLFGILMFLTSLFLILLILVQRGRGGGLAGAFGGMGGQSAFGTKAGDLFTRITIGVAALWIVLAVGAIKVLNQSQSLFGDTTRSNSAFKDSPVVPAVDAGAVTTNPADATGATAPASTATGPATTTTDPAATSPATTTPSSPAPVSPTPPAPAPSAPAPAASTTGVKAESESTATAPAKPDADKK
jgi:preprotein translocase subunit SecG